MTTLVSEAPGATMVPSTMADLIACILADGELTEARRRNLASSVRRFCSALDCPPEQAQARFPFFRDRLSRFSPARVGLKPHRWETIKSDVGFALKRFGEAPDPPMLRVKLNPAWQELRRRALAAGIKWWMSRLVAFCQRRGLSPAGGHR
jgi:hypothetical protein